MQKILFIDRDGIILKEPHDQQCDAIEKIEFLPGVFYYLGEISRKLDYKLVMVTNQDGLGTACFPEATFWPVQELMLRALKSEDIVFDHIFIDRSFEHEKSPYRKPGTAMLSQFMNNQYDLENSFVIGDRWSDMELAHNLGAKGILLNCFDASKVNMNFVSEQAKSWKDVWKYLSSIDRKAKSLRTTNETKINGIINLDGSGIAEINTGLHFFDHMLEQIAKHSNTDLYLECKGDLQVDEHHTVEDTAMVLGQLFSKALGKKAGIQRYGFSLPMDDAETHVLLDFGGRPWLVWDVSFKREKIGDVPTEMFYHFFKSFADEAKCNLNIKSKGDNEHHIIESIFKAFAKAIAMAKSKNTSSMDIPSTKGSL
jgi:imidazoleglycerol-phosphate dehydratase / histidinol-phosphatase